VNGDEVTFKYRQMQISLIMVVGVSVNNNKSVNKYGQFFTW